MTLTATDDRTVKATYYRLDSGATQTLSGGVVLIAAPVSGSQAHTLEFWSIDWAGNTETPHTTAFLTVSPDTQAPVTTSDAKPAYAGPVTIKLTATDNATSRGVQTTYYRFDGGATQTGTIASLPQPASGTVTRTIYFWSVDYSGNIEGEKSATFTVTNDSVAPTTTSDLLPAPKWYPAGKIVISLTSVRPQPVLGYRRRPRRFDESERVVGRLSRGRLERAPRRLAARHVGVFQRRLPGHLVRARQRRQRRDREDDHDQRRRAGSDRELQRRLRADVPGPADVHADNRRTLGGSGVADTWYRVDSGAVDQWHLGTGAGARLGHRRSLPSPGLPRTTPATRGLVRPSVYIQAGADTVAPSGSVLINAGSAWTNSTAVTLAPSATDAVGVTQMQFSNDNVTWSTWETYSAATKNWTLVAGNGTKTVYARYRDAAGNVSTTNDTIGLDATAPVTTSDGIGGTTYVGPKTITLTPSTRAVRVLPARGGSSTRPLALGRAEPQRRSLPRHPAAPHTRSTGTRRTLPPTPRPSSP